MPHNCAPIHHTHTPPIDEKQLNQHYYTNTTMQTPPNPLALQFNNLAYPTMAQMVDIQLAPEHQGFVADIQSHDILTQLYKGAQADAFRPVAQSICIELRQGAKELQNLWTLLSPFSGSVLVEHSMQLFNAVLQPYGLVPVPAFIAAMQCLAANPAQVRRELASPCLTATTTVRQTDR